MVNSSTLILIPVFNGLDSLPKLLSQLKDYSDCFIHIVDDGSQDGTSDFLLNSDFSYSSHPVNLGKGQAILTGVKWAIEHKYGWILTIDADLQHPPDFIPHLLEKKHPETIVVASRSHLGSMPLTRRLSNGLTSLLLSIRSNHRLLDSQCGFRLIPSKLFQQVKLVYRGFQLESELLIKAVMAGYDVTHVSIPTVYGKEKSAMNNIRDTIKFAAMYVHSFLW